MKTIVSIFLFLLGGPLWLSAGVIADGTGYFPVVVMVADEAGVPMQGVSVQLRDADQRDLESIADAEEKSRMARVGQPCDTNAHGAAVVFYYGGFTNVLSGAKKNYSRVVVGVSSLIFRTTSTSNVLFPRLRAARMFQYPMHGLLS